MSFKFLSYQYEGGVAEFHYQGKDGREFVEKAHFFDPGIDYDKGMLDRALRLALIILGTSYYKAEPVNQMELPFAIGADEAKFFDKIYQEGMSQFAYENNLTRENLAHFVAGGTTEVAENQRALEPGILVLLSGGKDSLLTAEKVRESGVNFRVCYITAQQDYPAILNEFGEPILIRREIDKEGLLAVGGMNGHVPVTLINEALALIQVILIGFNRVELGVGREGLEPHAYAGDLPVNHQWSKTKEAQDLFKNYVRKYISGGIMIGSLLENMNELEIAEEFAEKCWEKYGEKFSSCNVANYKQGEDNKALKWCGKCAKCANSYLLFCPYVAFSEQEKIFGRDLFLDPEMTEIFKGLLGIDGVMKPFECVASIGELRWAYHHRLSGYGELPFEVPE